MSDTYIEPVKQRRPWGKWLWRAWCVFVLVSAVSFLMRGDIWTAVMNPILLIGVPWLAWGFGKLVYRALG